MKVHNRLMKDEEFKAEYEKLKPRYDLHKSSTRSQLNITQKNSPNGSEHKNQYFPL